MASAVRRLPAVTPARTPPDGQVHRRLLLLEVSTEKQRVNNAQAGDSVGSPVEVEFGAAAKAVFDVLNIDEGGKIGKGYSVEGLRVELVPRPLSLRR